MRISDWSSDVCSSDLLQLFDWDGGSTELTRSLERAMRERDFTRASADWLWEVDSELRFRVLSDTATAALAQPSHLLIRRTMIEVLQPLARSNGEGAAVRSGYGKRGGEGRRG